VCEGRCERREYVFLLRLNNPLGSYSASQGFRESNVGGFLYLGGRPATHGFFFKFPYI
jgi:hypothetical protein